MNAPLLPVALVVVGLVAFDLLALRFGHDSRDGAPELPTVVTIPARPASGGRASVTAAVAAAAIAASNLGRALRRGRPASRRNRPRRAFTPFVPSDAYAFPHLDLAAAGK